MRRSFSARVASFASAPWMTLAPAALAFGQVGGAYPTQPYINPTYSAAYAPQPYASQPYMAPANAVQPPATQSPAAQPYGQPPYSQQPYGQQPYAAPSYAQQPYAPPTAPRPQFVAQAPQQSAAQPYAAPQYPSQSTPASQYPVSSQGGAYTTPMYTAKAQEPAPETVIPSPQLSADPQPMPAGQPVQDPAAAYGYPPATGNMTTPWSTYGGCDQQPYGADCYGSVNSCDTAAACPTMNCCPPIIWEVYGGPLLMWRDDENHYFYSYDSAIESNQYLDSREAYDEFLPGFEVGFRRFNCCTCKGWEGVYWGLFPGDDSASVYSTDVTGNLDPVLDYSQLDYNGATADNFTNAAQVHRVTRYSEIHNAELNRLWGVSGCGSSCSPWQVNTLAGFRYFRVKDYLEFAADTEDTVFNRDPDELYYSVDTENDLYGGQIGAEIIRRTAGRLSFTGGMKAGVFCNSASATSWIGGSAGTAVINNGPNNGREWLVTAEKDDVAFLGEAKAGLAYQIGQHWRIMSDYRVIGVSGLALPTNQIYPDLRGINDVELLKTNGSLFLHGVFFGSEWIF